MNLTNGIEQDYRIAQMVFSKYINAHYHMKDDLIQEAVLKLQEVRPRYTADKGKYITFAAKIARETMIDCIRANTNALYDISIYDNIGNGLTHFDLLGSNETTAYDLLRFYEIVRTIKPLINLTPRTRKIIELHLKHYTQSEIAVRVGISQKVVSGYIRRFRNAAAELLGIDRRDYK